MLYAFCSHADEGIVTDRPDFVESSDVVGKGRFQLETSVSAERSKVDGLHVRSISTPTLLRLGVGDTLELRMETDGWMRETSSGVSEHGMNDISVGTKWHVLDGDESSNRPSVAWLLHFDLATGSRAFRGQGTRPSLRLTAEWDLPDGYGLGVMTGAYRERNDAGRSFTGGILAATFGKSFTEKLHGFVELAGQQITSARNGGSVVTFDTGASYLLSESVQVDSALFFGLNKTSPDVGWTIGISAKF
ncbi:transporter [Paucibacter sp. R3-3]|uniref:Transporter n=1 Tax=Roseateles agri TaxID=3098619 RepID=A0ABU5DHV4_9BURK|nr:transporter [Paucibacter sp. R3-3]MDY0745734.1 transporter [Paucibacter sp. R3-3]